MATALKRARLSISGRTLVGKLDDKLEAGRFALGQAESRFEKGVSIGDFDVQVVNDGKTIVGAVRNNTRSISEFSQIAARNMRAVMEESFLPRRSKFMPPERAIFDEIARQLRS